jgi:hypothetical protein
MEADAAPVQMQPNSSLIKPSKPQLDTVYVDQQENGGQWSYLSTYVFNGQIKVDVVSENNSRSNYTDAVRLTATNEWIGKVDASLKTWGVAPHIPLSPISTCHRPFR